MNAAEEYGKNRVGVNIRIRYEYDPELSLRDKGTLLLCLALLKENERPTIENIKCRSVDAETGIRSSLTHLAELGYYKAIKYKKDGKGFDWRYEATDTREVQE